MIRSVEPRDAEAIAAIYNHYVEKTPISFEEAPVPVEEMRRRIEEVTASFPWLVFEEDGRVVGFSYATAWKSRCAYRHSAETVIYLAPEAGGRGIGTALYTELLSLLRARGLHSVIGGIALPNAASVALHEKMGYEKIAHFKEVGRKFGRWIDVGYWELVFPEVIDERKEQ